MTWLNAPSGRKDDRLPVRVTEHNAVMPSGDGNEEISETCTVITTLLDHQAAPPTRLRETISPGGARRRPRSARTRRRSPAPGPHVRPGPAVRVPPRLVIQEAWAWLTAAQLTRASAAAALRGEAAQARALRRKEAPWSLPTRNPSPPSAIT